MRILMPLILAGLIFIACQPKPVQLVEPPSASKAYVGGMVWTGADFEAQDIGIIGDRIVSPFIIDDATEVVDASGKYITPALANGHEHITNATMENSWFFFDIGVYYVWNPTLYSNGLSDASKAFFARPDSIEVKNSLGGITEPKSHPEPLYVDNLGPYVYGGATYKDMFQKAFHYGRTPEEIVQSLDRLKSQGADIVKIYLLDSEEYTPPNPDGSPNSMTGLNPENVAFLVEEAHARGLRVIAHVESRNDVEVCAKAGVDVLGHLPGYSRVTQQRLPKITLSEADAELVAEKGMLVIPTYALARIRFDTRREKLDGASEEDIADLREGEEQAYKLQKQNLQRLKAAGAQIAMGTDLFPGQLMQEADHWVKIGAMTPLEASRAMFETGPALFPDRKIGCFENGCEADFLIMAENPGDSLTAFSTIEQRIKAGVRLTKPASKESD